MVIGDLLALLSETNAPQGIKQINQALENMQDALSGLGGNALQVGGAFQLMDGEEETLATAAGILQDRFHEVGQVLGGVKLTLPGLVEGGKQIAGMFQDMSAEEEILQAATGILQDRFRRIDQTWEQMKSTLPEVADRAQELFKTFQSADLKEEALATTTGILREKYQELKEQLVAAVPDEWMQGYAAMQRVLSGDAAGKFAASIERVQVIARETGENVRAEWTDMVETVRSEGQQMAEDLSPGFEALKGRLQTSFESSVEAVKKGGVKGLPKAMDIFSQFADTSRGDISAFLQESQGVAGPRAEGLQAALGGTVENITGHLFGGLAGMSDEVRSTGEQVLNGGPPPMSVPYGMEGGPPGAASNDVKVTFNISGGDSREIAQHVEARLQRVLATAGITFAPVEGVR